MSTHREHNQTTLSPWILPKANFPNPNTASKHTLFLLLFLCAGAQKCTRLDNPPSEVKSGLVNPPLIINPSGYFQNNTTQHNTTQHTHTHPHTQHHTHTHPIHSYQTHAHLHLETFESNANLHHKTFKQICTTRPSSKSAPRHLQAKLHHNTLSSAANSCTNLKRNLWPLATPLGKLYKRKKSSNCLAQLRKATESINIFATYYKYCVQLLYLLYLIM
jgi:hypothetical protein